MDTVPAEPFGAFLAFPPGVSILRPSCSFSIPLASSTEPFLSHPPAPVPIPHDFVHVFQPQLPSPRARARRSLLHACQSTDTENAHVVGQERPSASSSACVRRADKYPWCPFSIQLKCSASLPAPPSAHARSHLVPSRNPPAAPHAIRETIISLHHRISSYSRSQSLIPLLLTASPLPTARSFRYRRTLPSSQAAPLAVSFWTHVCRH